MSGEMKVLVAGCVVFVALLVVLGIALARSGASCEIVGWTAKGEAVYQCYDPTPTPR